MRFQQHESKKRCSILFRGALLGLLFLADSGVAQATLLQGTCEAFVVQGESAQLRKVYGNVPLGPPAGIELNNMGYHIQDKLLYALELTPHGNNGLVQIDGSGFVSHVAYPEGLPLDRRFDAGDVSPDGKKMYVNRAGLSPIYTVDLEDDDLKTTSKEIVGSAGFVHDWAAHRNGLLYGGDSSHGQIAVLDPATGLRADFAVTSLSGSGLPKGIPYGAAWFSPGGKLSLHRNDGLIVEVDLGDVGDADNPNNPSPVKWAELTRSGAGHNDGAGCTLSSLLTVEYSLVPCQDVIPPGNNCKDACEVGGVGTFVCSADGGFCYCNYMF